MRDLGAIETSLPEISCRWLCLTDLLASVSSFRRVDDARKQDSNDVRNVEVDALIPLASTASPDVKVRASSRQRVCHARKEFIGVWWPKVYSGALDYFRARECGSETSPRSAVLILEGQCSWRSRERHDRPDRNHDRPSRRSDRNGFAWTDRGLGTAPS